MTVGRGKHFGLTLLELLVVIVILGLVTATVTVRLTASLGPAALEQSVAQFGFADKQLRGGARHTARHSRLELEIGASQLVCRFDATAADAGVNRALSNGVRITKYLSANQELTYGTAAVQYDDRGASESFAIELTAAGDRRRWLLVTGLTGQITEVNNESAAREILQQIAPPGLHAG